MRCIPPNTLLSIIVITELCGMAFLLQDILTRSLLINWTIGISQTGFEQNVVQWLYVIKHLPPPHTHKHLQKRWNLFNSNDAINLSRNKQIFVERFTSVKPFVWFIISFITQTHIQSLYFRRFAIVFYKNCVYRLKSIKIIIYYH